jgi:uncharacterized protein (TIGR02996 family)
VAVAKGDLQRGGNRRTGGKALARPRAGPAHAELDAEGTGIAPFLAAIDASPDDLTTRLVLADWLEERGLAVAAAGLRWTAEKQRVPARDRKGIGKLLSGERGPFVWRWTRETNWRNRQTGRRKKVPPEADARAVVPEAVEDEYGLLNLETRDWRVTPDGSLWWSRTPSAALCLLLRVWVRLTDKRREALGSWEPPG